MVGPRERDASFAGGREREEEWLEVTAVGEYTGAGG